MKKLIPLGIISLYISLIVILASCGQTYHFNKFIDKGGKIETVERVDTLIQTVKGEDGKDSLVYIPFAVECPEPVIETRWKTRFNFKALREVNKHIRKLSKDSTNNAQRIDDNDVKENKSDNKTAEKLAKTEKQLERIKNRGLDWWLFYIGYALGVVSFYFLIKKVPFIKKILSL